MTAKVVEEEPEADRLLVLGKPDYDRCDNKVVSARYTIYNFIPVVRNPFVHLQLPLTLFSSQNEHIGA